ncbi:DUF4405 domain-containing protein [Dysosmobacter welbionis]|uniref:DUF4405 domain-containing protein n=1 Tax=Dysosmobacter welbionis TaxID=2093857 RepID=UPI0032C06524
MKTSQKLRMSIDLAMVVLLPVLMAYSLVGEVIHEWLGITMFLLFILHHAMNWRWYKSVTKGVYSAARILKTAVDGLLTILMFALPISGMIMAKHTFPFLDLSTGTYWARMIHLAASHWGLVLMSLHLGLHWNMLLGMARKLAHVSQPSVFHTAIVRGMAILLCICGACAFVDLQFGTYMLLQNQFVFLDFSKPLILSLAERLAVMCLFACAAHYLLKFVQSMEGGRK